MNATATENKPRPSNMPACPNPRQFADYLCGQLAQSEVQAVEDHLSTCSQCATRLQQAELENESLAEALKDTAVEESISASSQTAEAVALRAAMALPFPKSVDTLIGSIGAYELLEPIGTGGMGSVYLARHKSLNKRVAIKLLPLRWTPHRTDLLRRFEREIRAAGALEHPAIVAAHDAGTDADVHYLVMDLVDGVDLAQVARSIEQMTIADVASIGHQAAQGLAYAHNKGMVHRDIKPSNIMLDKSGQVRILDFGLVLMDPWEETASELTTVGQFLGTLDYMAPEQAERSGAVDYRADLYALGATLFRLLTGRAPLAAAPNISPLEKLRLLAHHSPPSLRSLRPDAPKPLIDLVDRLLSTDPKARPASATAVAEALEPLATGADLRSLVQQASQGLASTEKDFAFRSVQLQQQESKSRNGWWKAIALAMAPLALLAGVVITLVTDRGTLVIESDDPNVQLEIVRANRSATNNSSDALAFNVKRSGEQLVLASGEYELRMKSDPEDRFVLDRNRILISRGDREIVKVTRRHGAPTDNSNGTTRESVNQNPRADELSMIQLFKGRSFAEWLEVMQREQSVEGLNDAIEALIALASPDQQYTVAKACLMTSRQHGSFYFDGIPVDLIGGGDGSMGGSFSIESKSENFMERLVKEYWKLSTADGMKAILDELGAEDPRSTQACILLISELRPVSTEYFELAGRLRDQLLQIDIVEMSQAAKRNNGDPTPTDVLIDQARARVFSEVLRLTVELGEPIASIPALAEWFTDYVGKNSTIGSLPNDWLTAVVELDLASKLPAQTISRTVLSSSSSRATDVERLVVRYIDQQQGEALAQAIAQQILDPMSSGMMVMGGRPIQIPPIEAIGDLLVNSSIDHLTLADRLEQSLAATFQYQRMNEAMGRSSPETDEQAEFTQTLIKRLRKESE